MKNQIPVKYVARAILEKDNIHKTSLNYKPVKYFVSVAYIREIVKIFNEDGTTKVKYGIDFVEKQLDDNIEDHPTATGYYYGQIFDKYEKCQEYVDSINKKLAQNKINNFHELSFLKQSDYFEHLLSKDAEDDSDSEPDSSLVL